MADCFEDVTFSGPVSVECIQTVVRKLADKRRCLMSLAKDTLSEIQLGIVRPKAGVLDSDAAVVVRLLREAGVDMSASFDCTGLVEASIEQRNWG